MRANSTHSLMTVYSVPRTAPALTPSGRGDPAVPALPSPLKLGSGCTNAERLYAGLGSMGRRWMVLDGGGRSPTWQDLPEFPGTLREQAVALPVGADVLVFGGMALPEGGEPSRVLDDVFLFDGVRQTWHQLDTQIPGGLLGATGVRLPSGQLCFLGGVDREVFDTVMRELAQATGDADKSDVMRRYLAQCPEDYRFQATVRCYDPARRLWTEMNVEGLQPVVGAAVASSGSQVWLVNGEIKPGLRTDQVQRLRSWGTRATLEQVSALPCVDASTPQEGLAGAFCGFSRGVLLCAGGTNFPGARHRFQDGHMHAHQGLTRAWRREVYAYLREQWTCVGELPEGRAYGLSHEQGGRLWLIGGEGAQGQPLSDALSVEWTGTQLSVGSLEAAQA